MADPTIPDVEDKELPLYVCHKEVRALKIARVEYLSMSLVRVYFEDDSFGFRDYATENRPVPQAGYYYVEYSNGYYSSSPAEEFEDGYTLKQ